MNWQSNLTKTLHVLNSHYVRHNCLPAVHNASKFLHLDQVKTFGGLSLIGAGA